ncbi:MAG: hypothetical protein JW704_12130, partial [Anaerolineaceae bacterium]|nr:hypothetical protein [Anaerolineaceae bacterium]
FYAGTEERPTRYAEQDYAEYWAETVESWVYGVHPDEVAAGRNPNLGPLHVQYIGIAIRGQHVQYFTTRAAADAATWYYWEAAESTYHLSVIGSYTY